MRAHISDAAVRPLALLYGLDGQTPDGRTMHALLAAMGIPARDIAPSELSQTLETLVGLGGKTNAPHTGPAPRQPLIVFHAFHEARLDSLLDAMRAAKLTAPLKAVTTPHNRDWTVLALLEELQKEHALFQTTGEPGGDAEI